MDSSFCHLQYAKMRRIAWEILSHAMMLGRLRVDPKGVRSDEDS